MLLPLVYTWISQCLLQWNLGFPCIPVPSTLYCFGSSFIHLLLTLALSPLLRFIAWIYLTSLPFKVLFIRTSNFPFLQPILMPKPTGFFHQHTVLLVSEVLVSSLSSLSSIFPTSNQLLSIVSFPSSMSLTFLLFLSIPLSTPCLKYLCLPQKLFTKYQGYLECKIHLESEPKTHKWFSYLTILM